MRDTITKGLVTVVLPIFNVEKYLDRCIKSIVSQSYTNLEIILVDDESPDKCPEMCDNWANKDKRIKVIHKKNEGLGYARNTGIDNATGEYICFVDSDDYLETNTIEKAYEYAVKYKADIVSYGYNIVDKSNKVVKSFIPTPSKEIYCGSEILSYVLPNMIATKPDAGDEFWMSMCGGLFSTDLIRRAGWKMVSEREIISEDVFSLLSLYNSVQRIAFIPKAFYFYCMNEQSLTHTYRADRYDKIKVFYDKAISECDKYGYTEEVKIRLSNPYMAGTLAALKMIIKSDLSSEKKKNEFRKIVKDQHLQKVLNKMDKNNESLAKKVLWGAMRFHMYSLCYFLLSLRA